MAGRKSLIYIYYGMDGTGFSSRQRLEMFSLETSPGFHLPSYSRNTGEGGACIELHTGVYGRVEMQPNPSSLCCHSVYSHRCILAEILLHRALLGVSKKTQLSKQKYAACIQNVSTPDQTA
jgi:hypothetical protein